MKQREQYQACLDHAEPWLRTGTCTPSRVLCPCTSGQQQSEKRGKKTSNSDDTTCLRNSRRRQKRATSSGNACTGIRRTKGRKPWISGQNGREKWRNFGIIPEFYVPKKQKHRTSFAQSTALSVKEVRTFPSPMPESLPRPSLLKAKKTGKRRKNAPEQQHETTQKTSKYFDKTKIRIPKQSPDRKRRKVPFAPQKGHFLQPRAANMPTRETFQATGSIPMHEKAPPPQSIQRK